MAKTPFYFVVPPGLAPKPCAYCEAAVYWITTTTGKRMPVRCDVDGGYAPTDEAVGRGLSHFADCPGADRARKSR